MCDRRLESDARVLPNTYDPVVANIDFSTKYLSVPARGSSAVAVIADEPSINLGQSRAQASSVPDLITTTDLPSLRPMWRRNHQFGLPSLVPDPKPVSPSPRVLNFRTSAR